MKLKQSTVFYIIAIALGLISGMAEIPLLQTFGTLISDFFIRVFKCISLPIIALSLIVTLSGFTAERTMKIIWKRTILFTLSTTFVAAALTALLYLVIQPQNTQELTGALKAPPSSLTYFQHLSNLIPTNFFAPFIEQQVMGVLLIGILIGVAIRFIPEDEARTTCTHFFKGLHSILMVITRWIVTMIPVALFGFISVTATQFHHGMELKGIGQYLTIIVIANLIQGFVILPLWLKLNGLKPFEMMRKMLPALSLAFFSKSSAGTLPVTIETAEKNLQLEPKICRLVLPLCTSLNMNGCAAFIFATVIYLMQNHGIAISHATLIIWIFIATITAIGNAGVPMGCFFLSASLLASINVPITLMGVILPFYSLIDMLETALNVWSDTCVTQVVHEKSLRDEAALKKLSLQTAEL